MNIEELKNIWQTYDTKLEKSLSLNMRCIELIQAQKVKSKLKGLFILRLIEGITHLVILYYLLKFFVAHFFEVQFAISAAILLLFFIFCFLNCIKQLITIKQIDYSENITDIQRKLNLLNTHIVNYMRLTFLVLPTYMVYPIIAFKALGNFDIVSVFPQPWWIGQICFSIIITPVCIWLYRQVSIKNLHKKWVKYIIEKSAGESVTRAMQFIKQIDDYKMSIT